MRARHLSHVYTVSRGGAILRAGKSRKSCNSELPNPRPIFPPLITSSRAATMRHIAESLETNRVSPYGPRGDDKNIMKCHRAGPTARL